MPSKLYHITRRRKNALEELNKRIALKNKKISAVVAISGESSVVRTTNLEVQKQTLEYRIANGNHSSAWFRKQAKKKPIATENEAV